MKNYSKPITYFFSFSVFFDRFLTETYFINLWWMLLILTQWKYVLSAISNLWRVIRLNPILIEFQILVLFFDIIINFPDIKALSCKKWINWILFEALTWVKNCLLCFQFILYHLKKTVKLSLSARVKGRRNLLFL